MRPSPVDITLGGQVYTIRPLTLRQTRSIEVATSKQYETQTDRLAAMLEAVLSRDHADKLPAGGLLDMEVDPQELAAAADAIKRLSGMRDVPAGEAKAAMPAATNSGVTSTAG